MNKHDTVIELIKEWLTEDMFDEERMILNNASDLLEQYGRALERLGSEDGIADDLNVFLNSTADEWCKEVIRRIQYARDTIEEGIE